MQTVLLSLSLVLFSFVKSEDSASKGILSTTKSTDTQFQLKEVHSYDCWKLQF